MERSGERWGHGPTPSRFNGWGRLLDLAGLRPPLSPAVVMVISREGLCAHSFTMITCAGDFFVCVDPVALLVGGLLLCWVAPQPESPVLLFTCAHKYLEVWV